MQQSRAAAIAARGFRVLSSARNQCPRRGFAVAAGSTGRTADPADPHGNPDETQNLYEPDTGKPEREEGRERGTTVGTDPLTRPRSLHGSSPRLERVDVENPAEPHIQQKRRNSTTANLKEVSCAGLDGSPWPEEERNSRSSEASKDDKEYFSHHKASPLSEIEIADTRKPMTRATDGTASGARKDFIGWLPEQLDTAEEALERARRIWLANAMRGDPDSPHGRVLRELRGEWF